MGDLGADLFATPGFPFGCVALMFPTLLLLILMEIVSEQVVPDCSPADHLTSTPRRNRTTAARPALVESSAIRRLLLCQRVEP